MNFRSAVCAWQIFEDMESSSSDDDDVLQLLVDVLREVSEVGVVSKYSDNDFKKHFRMERSTCSVVTQMLQESRFCPSESRVQGGGTTIFPAEDYILVFLYFAGNKVSYRLVADTFGVAESTVFKIINVGMDFFCDIAPIFINFPSTTAAKDDLADKFFQIAGFPNVIGCVDGSYIPINKPSHKIRSTYVNRHDKLSITLQGVCEARKRFIDVFTGVPSKVHDSRVFKMSPLSSRRLRNICENKFHILGDSAYELREWLLTPYRNYELFTREKKRFNNRFCSTRVVAENSFGILKKRCRQLHEIEIRDVDRITKFIVSCCVIHNICIDQNDDDEDLVDYDEDDESSNHDEDDWDENEDDETPSNRLLLRRGQIKRNLIFASF